MKRLLFSPWLLFGGLCSVLSAEQPVSSAGEKFSFVQMCDTQLGMGGYEHDVKTFTLAVDQINKMKPVRDKQMIDWIAPKRVRRMIGTQQTSATTRVF